MVVLSFAGFYYASALVRELAILQARCIGSGPFPFGAAVWAGCFVFVRPDFDVVSAADMAFNIGRFGLQQVA